LILDSSAVVTMLIEEEGWRRVSEAVEAAEVVGIGAPTLVETDMVMLGRFDLRGSGLVAQFLEENHVIVIPFGREHRHLAAEAFVLYGKGRHPARLNYGDCMTYASAHIANQPLLFTGKDFAKTDLVSALD
jgi:ribonuclease VapC